MEDWGIRGKHLGHFREPWITDLAECESTESWTASGGADVGIDHVMFMITPRTALRRHGSKISPLTENNGRVNFVMKQVDLNRKPAPANTKSAIPPSRAKTTSSTWRRARNGPVLTQILR
jgi:hypothetical protein